MLVGPVISADNAEGDLVEPPGIAPGSGSLITRAFIAIVRANPDMCNISHRRRFLKGLPPAHRRAFTVVGQIRRATITLRIEGAVPQLAPLARCHADALGTV